ncbi:hypothetical protein CKO28_00815 [Rhodovibrio sodomensis]|uniref:Uncharacterized protein n=1 Tax=Rhodovibrio sodomensis TaxID=1088 RepID=A0ABS1D833_9PROT|nr:hypothetical protein [Rhodovibrio sodomensis]MBK1666583.1 hypothetical protein [Rhodovibrio sodomensis]
MDLKLDKPRLNRWARLLRTYLINHQQCEIKHTNALSAIAAMLDQPNANTLTALLRAEAEAAQADGHADGTPDDGRSLHFVTWTWVEEPQAFMTLAWLTQAEAADLTDALNKIAAATGMICDIAIYDRSVHDTAAWHGNLTALVEHELKDALACWHQVEDDAGEVVGSYFDKYLAGPPAPKRKPQPVSANPGDALASLSNYELIKELRRRGCMACVFEPSDVAVRISRHPAVRNAELGPDSDPEAMARATEWLHDNERAIEDALTPYGNDEIDSLLAEQEEIPELPRIADEIHSGANSGMTTTVAELCSNQPYLADGIYRVVSDCDQVVLIERAGEIWQLAEHRMPKWAPPKIGDVIRFDQASDAHITVEQVPSLQIYYVDGVYTVIDQYGEEHFVEHDGDGWSVVVDTQSLD